MKITFKILNSTFSEARVSPYLEKGDTPDKVLEKYHTNIVLSEAMIPVLHYLETCLRNRIDQILKIHHGTNWLMNPPCYLASEQFSKKINKIIEKVRRENKRDAKHNDIVAQMTFGFWCSFFHKKYDPLIWHRKDTFKIIFPNLPRKNRKRSYIEHKVQKIKEIRDRIAHHEPVWNRNILDAHQMCCDLIEAMSNDAVKMLKMIDRFPSTWIKLCEISQNLQRQAEKG